MTPISAPKTHNPAILKSSYRPDIQGLRAVAVIAVLLFHLGVPGVEGGFIGVDVFFVISGYLITKLIVTEIAETGQFRFGRFYLRRIRRLFPALVFTIAASFAMATLIFTPEDLQNAARSLIAATFSVSNILFWQESGYFDAQALTKPFLHTWSLSVEEQFYLVWPALLVLSALFFGRLKLWITVAALGAISVALNVVVVDALSSSATGNKRDLLFFLTPFRIYELAIGALVVWTEKAFNPTKRVADIMVAFGALLVGASILLIPDNVPFPYIYGLAPCIGTAFLIQAGNRSKLTLPLETRAATWTGEISYSLYLVHWPLIVLYSYQIGREFTAVDQINLALGSVVLAVVSYKLVEQPFRAVRQPRWANLPFVAACGVSALVVSSFAVHAVASNGWPWRVPPHTRIALAHAAQQKEAVLEYEQPLSQKRREPFEATSPRKVLLIGDSMSRNLLASLDLNRNLLPPIDIRRLIVRHECLFVVGDRTKMDGFRERNRTVEECEQTVDQVLENDLVPDADVILIWQRWYDWVTTPALEAAFRKLADRTDAEIAVFGRRVEFHPDVENILRRASLGAPFENYLHAVGTKYAVNEQVKEAAKNSGILYIDSSTIQCNSSSERCFAFDGSGKLLYWDWGHWSLEGDRFFGKRIIENTPVGRLVKAEKLEAATR